MSARARVRHKFSVGDIVAFEPSRQSMPASANAYEVIRLLPFEGSDNLYRVKCATEPYERTAKEGELSRRST